MAQYAQRENDSATISFEITMILWKTACFILTFFLQIWLKWCSAGAGHTWRSQQQHCKQMCKRWVY